MRDAHLVAITLFSLLGAVCAASCLEVQDAKPAPSNAQLAETKATEAGGRRSETSTAGADEEGTDAERLGQATEAARSAYAFVQTRPDDGLDDGGGWQEASVVLHFCEWRPQLTAPYFYQCPTSVGMPIRAKGPGRISAQHAAQIAEEVTVEAADTVRDSRPTWQNQGAVFCVQLHQEMRRIFHTAFPTYGVTVKRP